MRWIAFLFVALILTPTAASAQPCRTLDFEDLAPGTSYGSGDNFTTDGVNIGVDVFSYTIGPCGGPTTDGFCGVGAGGLACGAGNELEVNNVTLQFFFGGPATDIVIPYGEFGGQVSLDVNGQCIVADNFASLPANWPGGVLLSVVDDGAAGQSCGEISLQGAVTDLTIGGQELWIDNLYFCEELIPTEATSWSVIKALYR